jgi:hypothetical protein
LFFRFRASRLCPLALGEGSVANAETPTLLADTNGDRRRNFKTDIESELLPTDRAIPIGLVNELVTNAVSMVFRVRHMAPSW